VQPPTAMQALRLGARAAANALWLAPVALVVAVAGWLLAAPATLFLGSVALRGALAGEARGTEGAIAAALSALASPRAVAIWAGLWLAGLLLHGALRLFWLSGALRTLGEQLSGRRHPGFAVGAVWGFPELLAAALPAVAIEALAGAVSLATALAAAWTSGLLAGQGGAAGLAALPVAGALTAAVLLPLLAGVLGDAAMARAALCGEGPAGAWRAAAVRIGQRPSAFLATALAAGLASLVLLGSLQAGTGALVQIAAAQAPAPLVVGPRLLAAAVGALAAAALQLWRLGAISALACHRSS